MKYGKEKIEFNIIGIYRRMEKSQDEIGVNERKTREIDLGEEVKKILKNISRNDNTIKDFRKKEEEEEIEGDGENNEN